MIAQEPFAQAALQPAEERRFPTEMIWDAVGADIPAQCDKDSTIAAEVERRFEAFKAGHERGMGHEEVFGTAKALVA